MRVRRLELTCGLCRDADVVVADRIAGIDLERELVGRHAGCGPRQYAAVRKREQAPADDEDPELIVLVGDPHLQARLDLGSPDPPQ